MTGAPPRVKVEAVIYVAVCLFAACGFGYALWAKRAEVATTKLPAWRQLAAIIAFLAVAVQVSVFSAFWIWPGIGRDYAMFAEWSRWVLPPFLVALPCTLAAKGASRWWLLASSVILFTLSFFIVLSA